MDNKYKFIHFQISYEAGSMTDPLNEVQVQNSNHHWSNQLSQYYFDLHHWMDLYLHFHLQDYHRFQDLLTF